MQGLPALAWTLAVSAGAALVPSGLTKLRRPLATARALYAADLPASFVLVRVLAGAEVVMGCGMIAAVLSGRGLEAAGIAVGTLYLLFAAFLGYVLIRDKALGSCGCMGAADLPPSWLHFAVDALAASAACFVAFSQPPDALARLTSQPLALAWLANVALIVVLGSLALLRTAGATKPLPAGG